MIGKVQSPALPSLPEVSGVWQALKRNKLILSLAALLLIAAIVAGSLVASRSNTNAAYVTQPVARQDLTQAVTASGTVNPQNTVNVGTQVSGTISAIYVDYNSKVRRAKCWRAWIPASCKRSSTRPTQRCSRRRRKLTLSRRL